MSETETSTRIRASKMWAVPAPSGPRPTRPALECSSGEVLDVVDVARHLLVGKRTATGVDVVERPPPALAVDEHGAAPGYAALAADRGDRLGVVDEGDGVERRAEQDDLSTALDDAGIWRADSVGVVEGMRQRDRGRVRTDGGYTRLGVAGMHGAGPCAKRLGKPAVVAARPARGRVVHGLLGEHQLPFASVECVERVRRRVLPTEICDERAVEPDRVEERPDDRLGPADHRAERRHPAVHERNGPGLYAERLELVPQPTPPDAHGGRLATVGGTRQLRRVREWATCPRP